MSENIPSSEVKYSQRLLGCCQCFAGSFGCPLFCTGSFLIGAGLTAKACLTMDCLTVEFERQREKWCVGCGVGTGCAFSTLLVLKGYVNMFSRPKPVIICQSEMVR